MIENFKGLFSCWALWTRVVFLLIFFQAGCDRPGSAIDGFAPNETDNSSRAIPLSEVTLVGVNCLDNLNPGDNYQCVVYINGLQTTDDVNVLLENQDAACGLNEVGSIEANVGQTPIPKQVLGPNVLVNGDLSEPTQAPWQAYLGASPVAINTDNNEIEVLGLATQVIQRNLLIKPSTRYLLRFDVRADSTFNFLYNLIQDDVANSQFRYYTGLTQTYATPGSRTVETQLETVAADFYSPALLPLNPDGSFVTARLRFSIVSLLAGHAVYFDNLELREDLTAPAPAPINSQYVIEFSGQAQESGSCDIDFFLADQDDNKSAVHTLGFTVQ